MARTNMSRILVPTSWTRGPQRSRATLVIVTKVNLTRSAPRVPCSHWVAAMRDWRSGLVIERKTFYPYRPCLTLAPLMATRVAVTDRKSVVKGKRGSVRVDLGGGRNNKKK